MRKASEAIYVCGPLRSTWESARVMWQRRHSSLSVLASRSRYKLWKCLMNVLFSASDWLPFLKQQTAPQAKYSVSRYCIWFTLCNQANNVHGHQTEHRFDKRTLNVTTDWCCLMMIRDMSSPPVASLEWCMWACVRMGCIHSDYYYTARMNRLQEDPAPHMTT